HFKLILAREEGEGKFLQGYKRQYPTLQVTSHGGPFTLIDGEISDDELMQAASIVARYSQGRSADEVTLEYADTEGEARELRVRPASPDEIPAEWVL
ncbi:MAG: tRNA (5-methylaminomethyl-2-thiouridylate)-methyltransferase, partial [Sedimenticolaceae bacterium]|nr:tRNA (5-methylaminomethyl-2-thiouridylate)-methyltransferase [Sedimenticolaceae bacterium]